MAGRVFISYGRADMHPTPWVERLRLYLAPNQHAGGVETWDDRNIGPGADWRQSIAAALDAADAAILLVGPGFLASQFVMTHELPRLLSAMRGRGMPIFPLVVGFCAYKRSVLEPFNAVNDPDQPLESLPLHEQNRTLSNLAQAVDDAVQKRLGAAGGGQPASTERAKVSVLTAIQQHLGNTRTAFIAQVRRRNDLVEMIESRLRKKTDLEYEKFFFRYFPELTSDERFEFDQIRAITDGPLHGSNRTIFDLLESHADVLAELPVLLELRQHLVFWLNKYDRVFSKRPEMCVLYTGVEDAVPFPNAVDDEIDRWLRQHAPDRRRH